MKILTFLASLFAIALSLISPAFAQAQTGTPTYAERYAGQLGPNRSAALYITVTNTTDSAIVVEGVTMTDLIAPAQCPRHWFGDAGYPDRPRGEDEQNPPVPAYDLPSAWLGAAITLQTGEAYELPAMNLFMIQAAPNACQRISLAPVYEVAWSFVPPPIIYGSVSGTITDAESASPLTDATVSITGTTDAGVVTENISVDANGNYSSTTQYHADSALTVEANAPGYQANAVNGTVTEGANSLDVALAPVPVPTASVSGAITDSATGAAIPQAIVTISGSEVDGNTITETVTASQDGTYASTLAFTAASPITVSVEMTGYEPVALTLESPVQGANDLNLQLTAEAVETPSPSPTATSTPVASPTSTIDPTVTVEPTSTATVEPTQPSTPGPTQTATAEPTSTATTEPTAIPTDTPPVQTKVEPSSPVTGLPSTGSGPLSGGPMILAGAVAAAAFCAAGIRRLHK